MNTKLIFSFFLVVLSVLFSMDSLARGFETGNGRTVEYINKKLGLKVKYSDHIWHQFDLMESATFFEKEDAPEKQKTVERAVIHFKQKDLPQVETLEELKKWLTQNHPPRTRITLTQVDGYAAYEVYEESKTTQTRFIYTLRDPESALSIEMITHKDTESEKSVKELLEQLELD